MHEKKVPNQVTVAVSKISHTGKSTLLPEFEYMKTLFPQEEWKHIKITMASPSWYVFLIRSCIPCLCLVPVGTTSDTDRKRHTHLEFMPTMKNTLQTLRRRIKSS